jgi:hypothetical protein
LKNYLQNGLRLDDPTAPTNLAEAFNKSLANGEPSTHGTGLTLAVLPHCWDEQTFVQA